MTPKNIELSNAITDYVKSLVNLVKLEEGGNALWRVTVRDQYNKSKTNLDEALSKVKFKNNKDNEKD